MATVNRNFVIKNGLEVDTNTLYVDATNNNVGIGITNPTSKLHIGNSDTTDLAYLRVGNVAGPNRYYRYISIPAKATAAGVADTAKSLYIGRLYNGVNKLTCYVGGNNNEEGLEIHVHRTWGINAVPMIVYHAGHKITGGTKNLSFHYQAVDNESYYLFASFSYNFLVPINTVNDLRIDVTSISSLGTFSVGTAPTIPTLNSSNQLTYGLYIGPDGRVGVGNNTNPAYAFDGFGILRMSSGSSFESQIISRNDATDNTGSYFILEKSRGGQAVQNGDALGTLIWRGIDTNNTIQNSTASVWARAEGTISAGVPIPAGLYLTASSKFVFDINGEKLRIDNNGNVGIGTTNPQYKTHILHDGDTLALETQNISGRTTLKFLTNENDWELGARSSGEAISNSFYIYDNAAAAHRFVIRSNGYIGIGTTNPNRQLHITASGESNIVLENSSAGTDQKKSRIYHDSSNDFRISFINDAFSTEQYILWAKRGAGAVTGQTLLNPTEGNVGIGTTNAITKLDVIGNSRIGGATSRSQNGLTVGYTRNIAFAVNSDVDDSNRTISLVNESTTANAMAVLGFRVNPNTPTTNAMLDIKFVQTGATNTSALHYTFNHGGTFSDRFTILSSGNVGIGSTSPAVKLDIGGETSQYPYSLRIGNTAHATSKRAAIAFGNGAAYQILIDTNGNGTEDFSIYQANVNRSPFRIDATTGNICIGKGSAIAPTELGVNGYISESTDGGVTYHNVVTQQDIGFNANQIPLNQYLGQLAFMDEYSPTEIYNPSNTTAQLTIASTQTSGYGFIQLGKSATATNNFHFGSEGNGYLNFWNGNWGSGAGPRFTISSGGLVGINTSNPTAVLTIGPGQVDVSQFPNEGGEVHLLPGANGSKMFCYDIFINSFRFFTRDFPSGGNYFEIYRITDTGRVGIGITNPGGQVGINTAPQWSGFNYGANLVLGGSRNNGMGILDSTNGNPWWIGNGAGSIIFATMPPLGDTTTGASVRVSLANAGNVGIGTTNPTSKVHIGPQNTNHVYLASGNNGFGWILDTNDFGNNSVPFRIFRRTAGVDTESVTILNQSGFVGIGTTIPTQKLTNYTNADGGIHTLTQNASTGVSAYAAIHINAGDANAYYFINSQNRTADGGTRTATLRNDGGDIRLQASGTAGIIVKATTGNVGIDTASPAYKLQVNGSFAATTKSFVIDHPTKPGFKLRYGSLEGPENGVYIRGKLSGNNTIELPEYWTELVHEDSITVNLTPIGRNPGVHSVIDISDNTIVINSTTDIINCFFTVFAERKDVDKLITEYES